MNIEQNNMLVLPDSIGDSDFAKIAQSFGQDDGPAENARLPRLAIEQSSDDDEGNRLPKGDFRLRAEGSTFYLKKPQVRLFIRVFGYDVYNATEGEWGCRTVLKPSLKDEFLDTDGGLKCGKLSKAEVDALEATSIEKALQKSIKCSQVIYGVVERGSGTNLSDPDTPVDMAGTPFIWSVKGSSFIPISNFFRSLTKQKKLMMKEVVELNTKRHKNGTVVYYTADAETKNSVDFDEDNKTMLKVCIDDINDYNSFIIKEYRKAAKLQSTSDELNVDAELQVA